MGFTGHLWSHGIDYAARESALERLYRGGPDWLSAAKEIGATHIVWSEREKKKYGGSIQEWRRKLRNVSGSKEMGIYDLSSYSP